MAERKSIVVTVADSALKDIKGLAERLTQKGLSVDRVMAITGVITGTCDPKRMKGLEGIQGVASVEEELHVQLPDPDSDVQ